VRRITTSWGKPMNVDVEKTEPLEFDNPGLLLDLSALRGDDIDVPWFDVAARLEPGADLAMPDQQQRRQIR
jgi:hypothetical protein